MNNTVEFVVKMKNMMSGELGRLSATAQSSFNRMSTSAQGMTTKNQILGMSFNELQKQIQQVENTVKNSTIPIQIARAKRELADLQRQSARHSGNLGSDKSDSKKGLGIGGVAIGSMLGGFALQAGSALVGAVGSGINAMVSKSIEKEQSITGLSTFLGKDRATAAYKNIRNDADVTPFDTSTLLGANQSLISANVNEQTARKDVMNLGNAVSATSKGGDMTEVMSRMAQNLQQIKNTGSATGMDIKQFGFAGININEALKRSGQKTDGIITYEMITKALAVANSKGGMYEGAMAAQSQTIGGKWSTVKDKLGNAASDIGDAFSPIINKLLDLGIKFASGIAPALAQAQPYIEMLSTGVGKVVDFVMEIVNGTSEWSPWVELINGYFSEMWSTVSKIGLKLWGFIGSIIEFIKKSEILKDVFSLISGIFLTVMDIISGIINLIVAFWNRVVKPILEKVDALYKWIKGVPEVKITATQKVITAKKPEEKNNVFAANSKLANDNSSAGKSAGDTVTGGGPKVVNIHIGKFFDNLQFTTLNTGETAQQIESVIMECMARVVYNGSKLA